MKANFGKLTKRVFLPEIKIIHKLPFNFETHHQWVFSDAQSQTISEIHCIELKDVRVVHNLIFKRQKFLKEYSTFENITSKRRLIAILKGIFLKRYRLSNGVLIMTSFGTNYHHFIADLLPLIYLAKREGIISNQVPLVLPYYYLKYDYIKDILSLLQIPNSIIPQGRVGIISKAVIFKTPKISHFQPRLFAGLRSYFFEKFNKPKGGLNFQKIYISRAKATRRNITNEDELIALLISRGFRVLYTEQLSIQEQISIFCNCKVLISLHGAGLTNMAFMPQNSTVIELRALTAETSIYNLFWHLSSACHLKYYYLLFETSNEANTNKLANIKIDNLIISKLLNTIENSVD